MGSQIGLTGLWLFPVAFFSQIGKFYKNLKISKTAFLEWVAFTLTRAWQGEVLGRIFLCKKKIVDPTMDPTGIFFLYVIASPQAECQARVNVNATHGTKTRVAYVSLHLRGSSRSIYPAGITIGISELSEMRGRPAGRFLGEMTTPRRPGESLLQFLVGIFSQNFTLRVSIVRAYRILV